MIVNDWQWLTMNDDDCNVECLTMPDSDRYWLTMADNNWQWLTISEIDWQW